MFRFVKFVEADADWSGMYYRYGSKMGTTRHSSQVVWLRLVVVFVVVVTVVVAKYYI